MWKRLKTVPQAFSDVHWRAHCSWREEESFQQASEFKSSATKIWNRVTGNMAEKCPQQVGISRQFPKRSRLRSPEYLSLNTGFVTFGKLLNLSVLLISRL